MNDVQIDKIMKKYMEKNNNEIDIEKAVMRRIINFEEKRSARLLYFEYALSILIFLTGIASIFFIQYVFDIYSSVFEFFQFDTLLARWISTSVFSVIILSVTGIIYLIFKSKKEKNNDEVIPLNT